MTTPNERTRALRWAGEFLRDIPSKDLSEERKRELETILRHYPTPWEIAAEARSGDWEHKLKIEGPWLSPEPPPGGLLDAQGDQA